MLMVALFASVKKIKMFHLLTVVVTGVYASSKYLYNAQLKWILLATYNLYLNIRLFQKLS